MIQVATSPALFAGMPGDVLLQEGEHPQLFVPTTADLFQLDPLIAAKLDVAAEAGCWLWTGATVHAGNGRVPYGRLKRAGVLWLAHRWVYTLLVGEIAAGRELHHDCSTPLCVNPAHLDALDPDDHDWLHREAAAYADLAPAEGRPYRHVQPHHQQPPVGARAERLRALLAITHPRRT